MNFASLAFFARRALGISVFAWTLSARATDVSFDVQPRLLNLGETAQATLTFHGVRTAPNVEFPSIPGLQITGTGQQMQFGTGGSQVRLTYNLFPQKPGAHTIGPYELDYNGEKIQIPAVSLEVRAPEGNSGAATNEMIFARLTLPSAPPYVHQVFDLVLGIYSLPNVELTRDVNLLGGFPESGFVIGQFEELQMVREDIGGQFYNLRRFRAKARALTAGAFDVRPALRVGVIYPSQRRQQRDPFGFFDPFGGPSATPVTLPVPPANLVIRSIPAEGRPATYAGAVGQFDFTMDVRPRELKVGEPVTVTLRLQGSGNVSAALPPAYRDADLFKAYEARQVGDVPDPAAVGGSKIFEQVVIPRSDALKELPALQFSFFDPAAAQYRTVSAGPFPLTVHPSENGDSALLLQIPGGAAAGGGALVLGTDIVYLKPAPARWRNGNDLAAQKPFLIALHAAAPFTLAGLYFATRRRNRLATDVALARRQKAPRSARANLRKAEAALKESAAPAATFSALAAAAADYFGHRLNLPPGAVEAPLVLEKLRAAKADEAALAKWTEFFALSDQIRFASSAELSREALETWISTVASLLRKAERIKL
ncbi:MAG: BatD family protein [Kiritimatiellia bacterium]